MLNIKIPILQGAMAWISDARLAAAVSNSGGLGIIATSTASVDKIEKELIKIRELTNKPFGINIMLKSPTAKEIVTLVEKYNVPVVTCGAGKADWIIDRLRPRGIVVIPVISSVKHARGAESAGASVVIAEGRESGGHVGRTATMPLIPEIVDNIDIPVIAAGGILDGRGMVAAFALGAEAVQMGTRFICAEETTIHPSYQHMILQAQDNPTIVTGDNIKHPIRALKNELVTELQKIDHIDITSREQLAVSLMRGKLQLAVMTGDQRLGHYQCGEGCGLVHRIESASTIVNTTIEEFRITIRKLNSLGGE